MAKDSEVFRIRWADFKAIRKIIPANRGETTANYFHRVRLYLEACT